MSKGTRDGSLVEASGMGVFGDGEAQGDVSRLGGSFEHREVMR